MRTAPVRARRARRAVLVALVALVAAALSAACSRTPDLAPGPQARSAECSTALAAAPATVLDRPRTPLEVPGALSWGTPPVVLRCGLAEIGPTTATCLEIDGVDWVVDPDADPVTAVSYGRSPAVEVLVPAGLGREALPVALVDLGPVATALPTTGRACIG